MTADDVVVLPFGDRRLPRSLRGLPTICADDVSLCRRVVVVGSHADLAAVLTRLLRADRLDVEVAHVRRSWHARRARTGTAARIPLIRDETGAVITQGGALAAARPRCRHGPRRGDRRRHLAVRRRGTRCADRTDRDRAGSAGQCDVVPHARDALGRGSRCPARRRWSVGRSGRGGRKTAGSPVDVLSAHRGLAVGSVASNRERPAAAPPVIGAPQPDLPAHRRDHGDRRGAGVAVRRYEPADGLRRCVHLRRRRLGGDALPARVRPRFHGMAVRRPRRPGARLPDAQPASSTRIHCCRSCCRC